MSTAQISVYSDAFIAGTITASFNNSAVLNCTEGNIQTLSVKNITCSDTTMNLACDNFAFINTNGIDVKGSYLKMNGSTTTPTTTGLKLYYGLSNASSDLTTLSALVGTAMVNDGLQTNCKLTCPTLSATTVNANVINTPTIACTTFANFGQGQTSIGNTKLGINNTTKDTTTEAYANTYCFPQMQLANKWILGTGDSTNNSFEHDIFSIGSVDAILGDPDCMFSIKRGSGVIINPAKQAITSTSYDSALVVLGDLRVEGTLHLTQTYPVTDATTIGYSTAFAYAPAAYIAGNATAGQTVRSLGSVVFPCAGVWMINITSSIRHASGTPSGSTSSGLCSTTLINPTTLVAYLRAVNGSVETITTSSQSFSTCFSSSVTATTLTQYLNFAYTNVLATGSVTLTGACQITRIA